MKFALKPLHGLILAGLLATLGVAATAQPVFSPAPGTAASTTQGSPHARGERMGRHDPAKMQAYFAKRQAELKAKLKITPAQEPAWASYTASVQPPARTGPRPNRAEFDKLPTPERIDKMRALRTQRMAEMNAYMDKRGEATKALYAALSPEQQKVLDAESTRRGGRGHHGGKHGWHHRG